MIVLDASAALEMILGTPEGRRVEDRVLQAGETLHAPHLIDVEVGQVLRRFASAGLASGVCEAAMETWLLLPVQRYPHNRLLPRAWELRANFTVYDAVYIALAEALDAPLVTHDRKHEAERLHTARVELI